MIRVLIVDDHRLVRIGLTRMLADAKGMVIVGEADSGERALGLVRLAPERLTNEIAAFLDECWKPAAAPRRKRASA